jgi:hypothetical protein
MEWQILIAVVGVLAVVSIYFWGARRQEKQPVKQESQ